MSEDDDKLVLLKKTLMGPEAQIIKATLEAHNIPCFVHDDNASALGVGIGIINSRVMVLESQLEEAQALLKTLEDTQ